MMNSLVLHRTQVSSCQEGRYQSQHASQLTIQLKSQSRHHQRDNHKHHHNLLPSIPSLNLPSIQLMLQQCAAAACTQPAGFHFSQRITYPKVTSMPLQSSAAVDMLRKTHCSIHSIICIILKGT